MRKSKFMTLVFLVCVSALLSGCGEVRNAENTVNGMFAALKSLDIEEMQKYVDIEDVAEILDMKDLINEKKQNNEVDETIKTFLENILGNLSYEIVSSEKIDRNKVVVKTKITATDMEPVMHEIVEKIIEHAFENAFSSAFSDSELTREEKSKKEEEANEKIEKILVECTAKPDLAVVTSEAEIKVVRAENKKWKIEADENLVNALFGGLADVKKEMDD